MNEIMKEKKVGQAVSVFLKFMSLNACPIKKRSPKTPAKIDQANTKKELLDDERLVRITLIFSLTHLPESYLVMSWFSWDLRNWLAIQCSITSQLLSHIYHLLLTAGILKENKKGNNVLGNESWDLRNYHSTRDSRDLPTFLPGMRFQNLKVINDHKIRTEIQRKPEY